LSKHRNTAAERKRKRAYNREKGYWPGREKMWKRYGIKVIDETTGKRRDFVRRDYLALFNYQEGRDPLCGADDFWGSLSPDHDHKTGLVRGLLEYRCNQRAVGTFEKYGHYKGVEHEAAIAKYLGDPPYARMMRGAPFVSYWSPARKPEGGIVR
jgi:hypothetical protein